MRTILILVTVILAGSTAFAVDFKRYMVILDRKPFGELVAPKAAGPARPAPPPAPPLTKFYKMVAITEAADGVRVGIIDLKSKQSFFLHVGEIRDGLEVVSADYMKGTAVLKKGAQVHEIPLEGAAPRVANTTASRAVNTTRPVKVKKVSNKPVERLSYAERLKRRRELQKEERRKQEEGAATEDLSGEKLQKYLQEYQMELIRAKGELGPALPIPLTPEMDAKLVQEGVLPPTE